MKKKIFGLIVAFAVIAIAATANYVYNKKAEMALDAAFRGFGDRRGSCRSGLFL